MLRKLIDKIKGSPTPKRRKIMTNEEVLALRYRVLEIAAFERKNRKRAKEMYRYLTTERLRRGI